MKVNYYYIVRMDVKPEKETLFNEIYDTEHMHEILKVPGVNRMIRYCAIAPALPKYMTIYDIERPDIPVTKEWRVAADTGRWAVEIRPYTMNREHNRAVCTQIGGGEGLIFATSHLLLEMTDVERKKEGFLNEIYGRERVPALARLLKAKNIVRFRVDEKGHPSFLALYEIEEAGTDGSTAFRDFESEPWCSEILPYLYNTHAVMYQRIVPKSCASSGEAK